MEEVEQQPSDHSDMMRSMAKMGLAFSINQAFSDASPTSLRRWYVETFVLSPANLGYLTEIKPPKVLERMFEDSAWVSTEHAAIGHRLMFAMTPERVASPPDLMDVDSWRNEHGVVDIMMHVIQPWNRIRFDPEGENWYTAIAPGQWRRHGKGNPSNNAVEHLLGNWLEQIDPRNLDTYTRWPVNTDGLTMDQIAAIQTGLPTAFRKFKNLSTTRARIRQSMETNPIMYIDTATINQIRTIAPFSNGALALVPWEHTDTHQVKHTIKVGDLLPLDLEYMVTNANPLPWLDPERKIPAAAADPLTKQGDFLRLWDLEDELLMAHCPTYWSFLTHAFPEPEERSAFLRLYGAAMYGTNLKIVAALIGEPNAGKDTVLNWLGYVMPGQVATLPFSAFTPYGDEDRGFAPLRGARVATVSGEVGEGRGSKLLAEKIKTVSSGGGRVRVAEKYEKPTDIWFDGMLLLQGNSVPQIAGGDRALYTNRLVAVEFKHPFKLVARSYESEYRSEAPWFAQILFLNYLQYQHEGGGMRGINPPESWRAFAKEFEDSSNPHGFLESCIVESREAIPTMQFHQALTAMVQRFGSPYPVGPNFWPKRLRALGFQTKGPNSIRKQVTKNGKPTWCYYLTLDANRSDGMFTQDQWERILKDAAVTT